MANKALNLGVDLIPSTGAQYILGNSSKAWSSLNVGAITASSLNGVAISSGGWPVQIRLA